MAKKDNFVPYYLVLLLGIAVRILYYISFPIQPRDAYTYSFLYNKCNQTEREISPLAVKIFESYGTSFFEKGLIVNMVLGIVIVGETMIITELILKMKLYTVIAGLLAATNKSLVVYSIQIIRENFLISLEGLSIIFLCMFFVYKRIGIVFLALGCAALGVGTMCRYEALEFFLLLVCFLLGHGILRREKITAVIKNVLTAVVSYAMTIIAICFILNIDMDYFVKYINERMMIT